MTWQDIISKKTYTADSYPFEEYEQYDSYELTNIFTMILDKITDGEARKYADDAINNLREMEEDGTIDQYLKGMDEREYILRYIVNKTKIGEERITLSRMFSKIFGDKDFKLE